MKTQGMAHQLEALRLANQRPYFALFMEQGTGKTWTLLAEAERLYAAGKIEGLLVIAPPGVETNWVLEEIPKHLEAVYIARAWKSGPSKQHLRKMEDLFEPRKVGDIVPLRILAMSFAAVCTAKGLSFAIRFLRAVDSEVILDESGRIKNPKSARTEKVMKLKPLAHYRRIATGTPMTNGPLDVFSQMEFLHSGLLGTTSYRAFVAEFAHIASVDDQDSDGWALKKMIEKNPRVVHAQIVKTDEETGLPMWRNLEKLKRLLAPHSFRVTKAECLDLPAKIYSKVFFDLSPAQRRAYRLMKDELRVQMSDGELVPVKALAAIIKLQQITSGFVNLEGQPVLVSEENPRLAALLEVIEDNPVPVIVWARFSEELRVVADALRKAGRKVVEYRGSVSAADREAAKVAFQNGEADAFVGQPQSGGIGITLTAAKMVVYYSNDYNLETRLQSEDRAHRIGQKDHVSYIDLIATRTIDSAIVKRLQNKEAVAHTILGDELRANELDDIEG